MALEPEAAEPVAEVAGAAAPAPGTIGSVQGPVYREVPVN